MIVCIMITARDQVIFPPSHYGPEQVLCGLFPSVQVAQDAIRTYREATAGWPDDRTIHIMVPVGA